MKIVAYILTMPNVGSWNGKWTGEGDVHAVVRKYTNTEAPKEGHHYYSFGDGWGANVQVKYVDAKEAHALQKASKGFCGYDWMIQEIFTLGRIMTREERHGHK